MPQDHSGFVSSLLSDVSGNQKTDWGTAGKTNFYSPSQLPSVPLQSVASLSEEEKKKKGKKKGEGAAFDIFCVCFFFSSLSLLRGV